MASPNQQIIDEMLLGVEELASAKQGMFDFLDRLDSRLKDAEDDPQQLSAVRDAIRTQKSDIVNRIAAKTPVESEPTPTEPTPSPGDATGAA